MTPAANVLFVGIGVLLFYLAVSLFESGKGAEAATVLRRALPNLQRTPFIDAYARKILGQ